MSQQVTEDPPGAAELPPHGAAAAEDEHPHEPSGVRRLHSSAMIAEVLGVPPAAIRHWVRVGLLTVAETSGAVEWLDFEQLVVGRALARLLTGGLSLREIDAKLAGLAAGGDAATAARTVDRVVVDGRRLSIAREGRLLGAGGQLQFPFYTQSLADGRGTDAAGPPIVELPDRLEAESLREAGQTAPLPGGDVVSEILDLADELEAAGEYAEAAEALRAVLQAQGPTATVSFTLAELLYRAGDLTAARERYYATLEIDPEHIPARTSLGCVLGELGDPELALAALEGVLRQEPDHAEAHWHSAGVLAELGRMDESRGHLRRFLSLAPQSPWAALARERLERDG